jgi:hypothetical protein
MRFGRAQWPASLAAWIVATPARHRGGVTPDKLLRQHYARHPDAAASIDISVPAHPRATSNNPRRGNMKIATSGRK